VHRRAEIKTQRCAIHNAPMAVRLHLTKRGAYIRGQSGDPRSEGYNISVLFSYHCARNGHGRTSLNSRHTCNPPRRRNVPCTPRWFQFRASPGTDNERLPKFPPPVRCSRMRANQVNPLEHLMCTTSNKTPRLGDVRSSIWEPIY
jgi:hypothetical protein